MSENKKETVTFSITLPRELNEKLEQESDAEKRSKRQQISLIVEQHYDAKESRKPELALERLPFGSLAKTNR